MKIFDANTIKTWEAYTMHQQEIASIVLMERAAQACFNWLITNGYGQLHYHIFCGKGNNGGDGLALARLLIADNIRVTVYILETGKAGSPDFQENLQKLHKVTTAIHFVQPSFSFPVLEKGDLIIDALFGYGLNKPLSGMAKQLAAKINELSVPVVSIDLPSGMFADKSAAGNTIISATHTLSFQTYKLAFMLPENSVHTGHIHILDIGLSADFMDTEPAPFELPEESLIRSIIKPRHPFSHKGNYGHAALIAGSKGMMGAATLAAAGCMRTGAGKLTCIIPDCGYTIMQTSVPEAMCIVSGDEYVAPFSSKLAFDAYGIGPGLGNTVSAKKLLEQIFTEAKSPLLLDADALNCIATHNTLLKQIPPGSVITPHPKEFEKLFGKSNSDIDQLELARNKAAELKIYIVLKGHHTAIVTPFKKIYFNNTGNAGMAKAGMGDILTGIITGLMAQQYRLPEAAILGVYLHGLAGDLAAKTLSQRSMLASDLIHFLGQAWQVLTPSP